MKKISKISYTSPHSLSSLPPKTPVLLALSGGADSSALLHLLYDDAEKNGFTVHAAHFNHHIRGKEAERDALFCKELCTELEVPFYLGEADVLALAKENGSSLEAEAREQRYAFFEKIMRENGIPILVTAHHAEDQVETVLLHILRGSGIRGVCGMSSCRELADGLYLVRPLLNTEKQDILNYCSENNITFVTDSTNADSRYARNALRSEIIPELRKLQPNLCGVFDRLSKSAYDTDEFITDSAMEFIEKNCQNGICLDEFNKVHTVLRARALSILFEEFSGATLERIHIDALIELCKNARPHSSLSLPQKSKAIIEDGKLVFEAENEKITTDGFDNIPFCEGVIDIGNGIKIKVEKNPPKKTQNDPFTLDVKCEIICEDAHFRSRHEGDVIFAEKMNKKAKKLISEKKIPLNMRNNLPFLVSNNEILWIASVSVCDRIKKDKINDGENFYRITIEFES